MNETNGSTPSMKKMQLMWVECEICDHPVQVVSDRTGVCICAACLRDIASPLIPD